LCQSKIQGFETRESLSLRFPGNTLETPLDYPLSSLFNNIIEQTIFGMCVKVRPRFYTPSNEESPYITRIT